MVLVAKAEQTHQGLNNLGARKLEVKDMVDTLEAITILVTDPPLNRKRESLVGAIEVEQVGGQIRTIRSYLEELVENCTRLTSDGKQVDGAVYGETN